MTALLAAEAAQVEPWAALAASLRERDHDPAYADAPVLDAYARLSYNPDTGNLEKTDRQLADVLRTITHRRARLGMILRDDNKSAFKQHCMNFCPRCRKLRPDFAKVVDRLEARKSNGVVCWHTDRLMRQPVDLERLIWYADRGLTVSSCFGEYDLENADQRFHLRILTAKAAHDSDQTSRRQKRKAQAMRDAGRVAGGPRAFGFPGIDRITREPVSDSQLQAERQAIVEDAQRHLDGLGLTAIARKWNEAGLRTATGKVHDVQSVRMILARARNAGLVEHEGAIVGRATDVDPIIDEATFHQLRATLAGRRQGRPATGTHVGTGNLKCGACGKGLHSRPEYGKSYSDGQPRRQYRCSNCGKVGIDQRGADATLKKFTIRRLAKPEHAAQMASRTEAVADLDAKIAKAKETKRAILARVADPDDEMDLDDAQVFIGPSDRAVRDMRAKRDELVAQGAGTEPAPADVAALEAAWDDDSPGCEGKRRAMVQQAFPLGLRVAPAPRGGRRFDPERISPVR